MRPNFHLQRTTLALLISAIGIPTSTWATQINLAQYPAGTAYKAPIPNVILSIDTSGSMAWCDKNGTVDKDKNCTKSRIAYVMDGLKSTLADSTKYDDQFRLAWQSFACNGIPSSSGNCDGKNSIAKFSGTHKTDFSTWLNKLSATGSTPSQVLAWNAGKYLQKTGNDNPWNAIPGTADNAPLTCRRAYHIFLSDGGWNFSYSDDGLSNTSFKSDMQLTSQTANILIQNFDGKATTLPPPDNKLYDVSTNNPQTQIYRDNYGTETRFISSGGRNPTYTYYAYPTLADIAFYYWATDLQPMANGVLPKIRKSGQETFISGTGSSAKSVTFDEYWNPRNNPAKWQNLVQYTIGYGATASTLTKNTNTSPQWSGGTFGMYDTGFASLAAGSTKWDDVTSSTADDSFDAYRPQELWHMAINSRGKFYPVSGGDLSAVFSDIFDDIIVDTTAPISGFTSASGSVSRVGTQSYQTSYIAADDPNSNDNRWYGYVTSDSISTAGASTPNADWGLVNGKNKTTGNMLDAITPTNRLVLSYNAGGISFKWANLSKSTTTVSQQMWLNKGTVGSTTSIAGDGNGSARLDFLRGDRSKEASKGSTPAFRNRKSIQGDIVNSAIWYVGAPASGYATSSYKKFASDYRQRQPMIYVGGNDGMLHGFSAKDGTEKFAYVPQGIIQNLAKLSDPSYTHQYYVDGSPLSGDIDIGSISTPDWRTYLAGTLGAGGRGYFVLDVTNPGTVSGGSPVVADDFKEANAATLVVIDKTASAVNDANPPSIPLDSNVDADMGHIFGSPVVAESNQQRALQITRTNDNRWALIMGNGYNSTNERPVLLIQYLDGIKELFTIPAVDIGATEAVGNGLSTPQFLDVNGDGTPDFVYAGDLRGNMWKFDISSATATNWSVAFSGKPLFTATYTGTAGNSSRQPITAPPVLRTNSAAGGLMVAFGTGQNMTENDRSDTSVQTVYSILDNTRYEVEVTGTNKGKVKVKATQPTPTAVGTRNTDLVSQSVDGGASTGTTGSGNSAGRAFWKLTSQEVIYACDVKDTSCTAKKGWYMDLPVSGERVTAGFDFYDGSSSILEIISEKPASGSATASGAEVCAPQPQAAKTFRTLIGVASGAAAKPPILDVNGDGVYSATEAGYARMTASGKELRFATKTQQIRKGNDGKIDKLAKLPEVLVRPNWRQLK